MTRTPTLHTDFDIPCGSCRVLSRVTFMVDVGGRVPFGPTWWCESCADELTRDEHDDPTCTCRACPAHGRDEVDA